MVINERPDHGAPNPDPTWQARVDALQLDNERLTHEAGELRAALASARVEADRATRACDDALTNAQIAQTDVEQLRLDRDAYRLALRTRAAEIDDLYLSLRNTDTAAGQRVSQVRAQLDEAIRQRDRARADFAEHLKGDRERLEADGCELAATQLAKETVIGDLVTVRADLDAAREANAKLRRELEGVSASLVDRNVERARLARQVEALEARLAELAAVGQHPCHFEWTAGGYVPGESDFEPTVEADAGKGWWVRCTCHGGEQIWWKPGDAPHECPATGAQSNPPASRMEVD